MTKSLPNKHGPTVGIPQVFHGMVCWVKWLRSIAFGTGVAEASLKFLDIKISRASSVSKFRAASCPCITSLHKITCTVSWLCLCVWTYVLISVIDLETELWFFFWSVWMESAFCSDLTLGMKSSVLLICCCIVVQNYILCEWTSKHTWDKIANIISFLLPMQLLSLKFDLSPHRAKWPML